VKTSVFRDNAAFAYIIRVLNLVSRGLNVLSLNSLFGGISPKLGISVLSPAVCCDVIKSAFELKLVAISSTHLVYTLAKNY